MIKFAEVIYSNAVSSGNNVEKFEYARKYFSYALVTIDNLDNAKVNNNVPRALFGLIRACKAVKTFAKKEEDINKEICEMAEDRLKELYKKQTTLDVSKL